MIRRMKIKAAPILKPLNKKRKSQSSSKSIINVCDDINVQVCKENNVCSKISTMQPTYTEEEEICYVPSDYPVSVINSSQVNNELSDHKLEVLVTKYETCNLKADSGVSNKQSRDPEIKLSNNGKIRSSSNFCSGLDAVVMPKTSVSDEILSFDNCDDVNLIKMPVSKIKIGTGNDDKSAFNICSNAGKTSTNSILKPKFSTIDQSDVGYNEKKKFLERKHEFKKKLGNLIDGQFERSKITMFDLIYWNPPANPMPGQKLNERKKYRNSIADSEGEDELLIEEKNLVVDDKAKNNNLVQEDKSGVSKLQSNENSGRYCDKYANEEETVDVMLAPKVKIGPDGELIIDEKSLVVQTTAAKDRNKILSSTEVIEESKDSSHYGKWSKRRKRAPEWTKKETARFYKALSTVGTDFSLMSTVFSWRTRAELKIKFKKEERINKHLIDIALNDCTQFDFSIFEESEYDPVADRLETKELEKNEAKKRKVEEKRKRQEERLGEKKKKQEQKIIDKKRKKLLREEHRKLNKKKCKFVCLQLFLLDGI